MSISHRLPHHSTTPTRRQFLAATALAAVAGNRRLSAADAVPTKHKYIDIHIHLGAFFYGQHVSVKGLLQWMDEHDVERAVIQPLVSPESALTLHPMQTSDAALEAAKDHPDRLIAFCCLDPARPLTPRHPRRIRIDRVTSPG